jgi:hypothetical protein
LVEIEIGVMVRQYLKRRIVAKPTLISEIAAWERRRNREKARIDWMFTARQGEARARVPRSVARFEHRWALRKPVRSSVAGY